ncbi:DivIVA domain-containing protein [Microbacterium thalassium]|uniref:DivIVA domain-containing protein n=1 Tax=Microbacterium thalassium TaxID=362649 RepID=A0A7X0FS50_9MICO|nr:DivIVA domain-containing protein [Microbacterium thalassium]MBB6392549.1 DivIVA domain-containing protein [Microbacterium thalassium]GLK23220.1 hypothetical protein GCM10017607_05380 [Microbacterium thalassium]
MLSSDVRALTLPVRRRTPLSLFAGDVFDKDEVDGVLEACADALAAYESGRSSTGLRADDLVIHRFSRAGLFADGYDADEVDDLLDEIIPAIRDHEARLMRGGTAEDG